MSDAAVHVVLREVVRMSLLTYIDKLQRANADDLAFYPLSTLEKALAANQIMVAYENSEPCGYLWFGSVRSGYPITIYQACIDYDVRRRAHGWNLVADLMMIGRTAGANAIRLKCASSALSNDFWRAIGFDCVNVTRGGVKRGRDINHWWTAITEPLFQLPSVVPSTTPIDLSAYQSLKRQGVAMPSRFSRTHYGGTDA